MKYLIFILFEFSIFLFSGLQITHNDQKKLKIKLSEYHLFSGKIADQIPSKGVIPYALNTPLFSDYAEKLRFVKIPEGKSVEYNPDSVFAFPVGTILIKTFYFPTDFRDAEIGRNLLETRLLIHESDGWKALVYIWDKDQTDASLEVAGETQNIEYININGKKKKQKYVIPNLNQCKGCHNKAERINPIGPTAGQINGPFKYFEGNENQLIKWGNEGILKNLPKIETCPKTPIWNKPETGTLAERARAYLDINCAHCHNPLGPAMTSGLNLGLHENNETTLGINKSPVAAGRGSGNRNFDIVKRKPDQSILLFRMQSVDSGIMMPELGRTVVHNEGIDLIKQWIKSMK